MNRYKFFTIKKRYLIIVFIFVLIIALSPMAGAVIESLSPKTKYTVVLDAGHGGFDVK